MNRMTRLAAALLVATFSVSCSRGADARDLKDYGEAKALYADGRFAEAKALLERVVKDAPGFHQAALLLGKAELFSGDEAAAARRFEALAARREGYREADIWLLRSWLALDRFDDAEKRLQALFEYDQGDPRLFSIAASLYLRKGEDAKALAYFERAIEYDEDILRDRFEVARLHYRYGQDDRAAEELETIAVQAGEGSALRSAAVELLAGLDRKGTGK